MRWRYFFNRAARERQAARDIQEYLDIETEQNIARGMRPHEALAAARRKFGNPTLIREDIRRMYSLPSLESFLQDLLYALRTMAQKPIFTATILLTLALGIGGNAAIFSIVHAVFLEPLPYTDPSRLVVIWDKNLRDTGISKIFDSFQDFREIANHANVFEHVAAAT